MERKEEIRIIIKYLIDQIEDTAKRNISLLELRIVENGKLIEKYKAELVDININ